MNFLIIAGGILLVIVVIGVPVYLIFFGMAGRAWKKVKEQDKKEER